MPPPSPTERLGAGLHPQAMAQPYRGVIMNLNRSRKLGDPWGNHGQGPLLSMGLLALLGANWRRALGRERHANQKRMENSCGCLEMKHGYEQTTPASRCDSSGRGMKFRWFILNYERWRGGWQQQTGPVALLGRVSSVEPLPHGWEQAWGWMGRGLS